MNIVLNQLLRKVIDFPSVCLVCSGRKASFLKIESKHGDILCSIVKKWNIVKWNSKEGNQENHRCAYGCSADLISDTFCLIPRENQRKVIWLL